MLKVVTLGEILVEVMAMEQGEGFRQPLQLKGPYPSGAPAIFIDQVAKLGQPCGIIACIGDDDFGWLNVDRLAADGVSTSGVEVCPDEVTGSAFVRYRPTGERDFVFNIKASAARRLHFTDKVAQVLDGCGHLHVSGTSLFSRELIELAERAVALVKAAGGTVSFDPNARGGEGAEALAAFRDILRRCDVFFPSGPELTLLTEAKGPAGALAEMARMGVRDIVVKQGANGAAHFGAEGHLVVPGYLVEEVDPTGAGDCFAATFVTCRLQGRSVEESLDYANAAGARAVTVRGPMEGTSTFAQLDELRAASQRSAPAEAGGHPLTGGPRSPVGLSRPPSTTRPAAVRSSSANGARAGQPVAARRLETLVAGCTGHDWQESGITSVCSGHPLVLEAAARQAAEGAGVALVESTSNQVNHQGGYTGLTPAEFRDLVHRTADEAGLARARVLLGGDHLGPSPWRHLPAEEALAEAEKMVAAYVGAGYQKIHLDTSMGCRGEPEQLPDRLTAERAAQMAAVAEQAAAVAGTSPWYVIGTEVPAPGGARHGIEHIEVTRPESVRATFEAHRRAFAAAGAHRAWERVIAIVAQPGVEFDHQHVVVYGPERARDLSTALVSMPGLVFEAHSTDYQPPWSLAKLVIDGFAILKVGPGLSFAMREALYALDHIAAAITPGWAGRSLASVMEQEMLANPAHWRPYYSGSPEDQRLLRHFSYSDRIRYYWASPAAQEAVRRLFDRLSGGAPAPLVSQFLPRLYSRVADGALPATPKELVVEAVRDVLRAYAGACRAERA